MKARPYFFVIFCIFLFACSNDSGTSHLEEGSELNAIQLKSPEGFQIANSLEELNEVISNNRDIPLNSFEVEFVEYKDLENVSIAFVNYKKLESGDISNIVIVNGQFEYDTSHLRMSAKSAIETSSTEGDVVISCDGCENCRVQGYRDGQTGNYHFSCESSCCSMTVRELPREP